MARDKVRIRFCKAGDLRLVSHHDLMRSFERTLRRAGLPFRSTEGFHPTPRMVFAQALPLGVAGMNEVVELELTEEIGAAEVLDRLQRHAPPGLTFLSAVQIALNVTARPRKALYRMTIPPDRVGDLALRVSCFLASDECWIERLHPRARLINIRPFVDSLKLDNSVLSISMWISMEGSARADEVIRVLKLAPAVDAGAVLERTDLLLVDEMPAEEAARAPELSLRDCRPIPAGSPSLALLEPEREPVMAHWGASSSGPVVE